MASSKKQTTRKTAAETQAANEQPAATARKKTPAAPRRVPVQYTPRIPTARCPGC